MNTSPHDVDDEFLVSQFKDVMPSVFFTVNEKINDHVGLVACCSSFYSFEKITSALCSISRFFK